MLDKAQLFTNSTDFSKDTLASKKLIKSRAFLRSYES